MPNCQLKSTLSYYQTELTPVLDGLVMAYHSDSGSITSWEDRSGNLNNLTNIGGATREPLHSSGTLGSLFHTYHNGTSYLQSSSNPLKSTDTWSLCMAIKFTGIFPVDVYDEWNMLGLEDYGRTYLYFSTYNQLRFATGQGTTGGVITYTLGSRTYDWLYLVITTTSTGSQMFIDGISVGTSVGTFTSNTNKINIGKHVFGSGGFEGLMANVLFYNRVLSQSEISYNYTHNPIYYLKQSIT